MTTPVPVPEPVPTTLVVEPIVLPRDPHLVTLANVSGLLLPPHG